MYRTHYFPLPIFFFICLVNRLWGGGWVRGGDIRFSKASNRSVNAEIPWRGCMCVSVCVLHLHADAFLVCAFFFCTQQQQRPARAHTHLTAQLQKNPGGVAERQGEFSSKKTHARPLDNANPSLCWIVHVRTFGFAFRGGKKTTIKRGSLSLHLLSICHLFHLPSLGVFTQVLDTSQPSQAL